MQDLTPDTAAAADADTERAARTAFFLPILAAAVLLALVGVISIAGRSGDDDDPLGRLRAVPAAVEDVGSARMAMSMSMDGDLSMDFRGEGVVDFVTGAGELSMEVMGETVEMRTDGETVWVKLPAGARPPGSDAEWLATPVGSVPGAEGLAELPLFGSSGYFEALHGVHGEVEEVGREEVNGVDTTHYRFTVDLTRALDEVEAEHRDELEAAFAMAGDLAALPMEVWLSERGLPVRQVMAFDVTQMGMTLSMRMQVDLSDFGVEVDVEPPPAAEVVAEEDEPSYD